MVLLAGVTGSGKSTTIASMLNYINQRYRMHILTLEDPIEFMFTEDKCLINQREIGLDVIDFDIGMKHAVREDPDVMLVGEMRDKETFMTAIHAAETGHLVFGTIHASQRRHDDRPYPRPVPAGDAPRAPQRDRLQHEGHHRPEAAQEHQAGRRPRADGRDHDLQRQRPEADPRRERRQAGRRHPHRQDDGMQDFTMSLKQLVDEELIDREVAMEVAPNREALKMALKGIEVKEPELSDAASGLQCGCLWPCLSSLASPLALPLACAQRTAAACRAAAAAPMQPPPRTTPAAPMTRAADGRRCRPAAAMPQLDKWNDAHSIPRLKQPFISWPKLLLIWLLFLIWVKSADWVNRDTQIFDLGYGKWNPIIFFPFLAVLLLFAFPILIGFATFWLRPSLLVGVLPGHVHALRRHSQQGRAAAPEGVHARLVPLRVRHVG